MQRIFQNQGRKTGPVAQLDRATAPKLWVGSNPARSQRIIVKLKALIIIDVDDGWGFCLFGEGKVKPVVFCTETRKHLNYEKITTSYNCQL